jgi:DNA-binding NtrC family response regulator
MQETREIQSVDQYTTNKIIMVIEDDESIGTFLVDAINQETSYDALYVHNAIQAINVLKTVRPCLVITDYRLPYMSGLEFYDRVLASSELSDVPTIIMSAYMPEDEVRKRHITSLYKPFELDQFLDTVEQLLEP